jgi:hypothetical protein
MDPRLINLRIEDDKYPIPLMFDILENMVGAEEMSELDLEASYNQLPIHPDDQIKTAFTWKGKHYMFAGAPFGLKHLTSVFQRVSQKVCDSLPSSHSFVDNIVVTTSTDDHIAHLKATIARLTSFNLTLNLKKCKFGYTAIRTLGHYVSKEGIQPDPTKLDPLDNWPQPLTGKDVHQFIGLLNYLRPFIPICSRKSRHHSTHSPRSKGL